MPRIDTYTENTSIEDNDKLLTYDPNSASTKLTTFSRIWSWITSKLHALTSSGAVLTPSTDRVIMDKNGTMTRVEPAAVAKYGIETYNGSTIAGSAQTVQSAINALNSNLSSLYCREYSYASGTSYEAAVTDVLSKLGNTIARYWIIIIIGTSRLSLMIIKDGVQWSNGILTSYGSTTTDVYFVMSRSDPSGNTVVYLRKLLTGNLE